jgi:hypothetical protein
VQAANSRQGDAADAGIFASEFEKDDKVKTTLVFRS